MTPSLDHLFPHRRMPYLDTKLPNAYSNAPTEFVDRPPVDVESPCTGLVLTRLPCGSTRVVFNAVGDRSCIRCGKPR